MILLVGNYAGDRQESMQRFAGLMLSGLSAAGISAELIAPQSYFGRWKKSGAGLGKWLGYLDKYILFPIVLRRRIAQIRRVGSGIGDSVVVHICDHSNAPYVWALAGVPLVVTVHDLLAVRSGRGEIPENPTRWSGRWLQAGILAALRRVPFGVCDSTASRDDFLRLTGRALVETAIVPPALNYPYEPIDREAADRQVKAIMDRVGASLSPPFFLHIGGNQWYKNRVAVLRIIQALPKRLDGTGSVLLMAGASPGESLKKFAEEPGLAGRVYWVGKVSNEELQALYNRAEALIFPSLAEGFGWPPIEAQACGCPVITSERAPLTEVAGEAALYIDPEDAASGVAAIARLRAMSCAEREELREMGFQNAGRFSVARMLEGYRQAYKRVINDHPKTLKILPTVAASPASDEVTARHQ